MKPLRFSRGPWRQERHEPGFRFAADGDRVVHDADGYVVAMVIQDSPPNAEPNADLIAAAPELYTALSAFFTAGVGDGDWLKITEETVNRAKAAMAKARGER